MNTLTNIKTLIITLALAGIQIAAVQADVIVGQSMAADPSTLAMLLIGAFGLVAVRSRMRAEEA